MSSSVRCRGVCTPSRRQCTVAASVRRRGVHAPSIATNRIERPGHARRLKRRRPLGRLPRCSRSGRWRQSSRRPMSSFPKHSKDTHDGFCGYLFRSSSFMNVKFGIRSRRVFLGTRRTAIVDHNGSRVLTQLGAGSRASKGRHANLNIVDELAAHWSVSALSPMFSTDALERVHGVPTTMLGWTQATFPNAPIRFPQHSRRSGWERGKQIIGSAQANPGLSAPLPSTCPAGFLFGLRSRSCKPEDNRNETQKSKKRARAAFGSDHYRSAFESATGALPISCNFGTTDVYTKLGPNDSWRQV